MPYKWNRLGYPFSYRTVIEQDDNRLFVPGDASDTTECTWYVVSLTAAERLKFTSALLAGFDLLYPDEFVSLMQLWLQPTEYPNQIPEGACMDLCQLIADCINDTEEIQQLIAYYSNSSAIEPTTPENGQILAVDLAGNQANCNLDNLYGMTLQLTQFLNVLSEDILELFVTAFATPARIGDIIEAIPGIGLLPADDVLQFTEKMSETINDAYQAAYDSQVEEDISCELFCIAKNTCQLTIEQARDYFRDKFTVAVSDQNFFAVVNDIIANNWIGLQSIYVIHWFILDTIIFGGEILGIDANRVLQSVSTFYNDPNPDWSLLCTNCAETYLIDFTTLTDNDWDVTVGIDSTVTEVIAPVSQSNEEGNIIPSAKAGLVTSGGGAFAGLNVEIVVELTAIKNVSSVSFQFWYDSVFATNVLYRSIVLLDSSDQQLAAKATDADNAIKEQWNTYNFSPQSLVNGVKKIVVQISVVGDPNAVTYANTYGFVDNIQAVVS